MNHPSSPNERQLRVQTPCPKTWSELSGAGARRFCSECSLHVHDAAQLTKREAERLVETSTERVCMRMTLDETGAPIYRDSSAHPSWAERLKRWALPAAAGLLAACHGSNSAPAVIPSDGVDPESAATTIKLGKVAIPVVLGDVRYDEPPRRELLGEVREAPQPPAAPTKPPAEAPDASKP